jgi:tripartite-type tricarboxylate transporter receptor subunit TctC
MKKLVSVFCGLLVGLALAPTAVAQEAWPSKHVQIIVPFAPGSLTDIAARAIAGQLSQQMNQTFVVDNKGGAGGTIGTSAVAKAAADGYTLVFTDSSFMISAALYPKLPYDPLKDFVPVTLAVEAPAVMVVRNSLPASSVREFVALAKAKPGELNFGSGGIGSSGHLSTELFMAQTGTKLVHVPFKGVGAAFTEIMANRLDLALPSLGAAAGQIRAGSLKPLAVTGSQRAPAFPDVPTFAQAGFPDFDVSFRFGFLAPTGTPPAVIARLQSEIATALKQPQVQQFLAAQGAMGIDIRSAAYGQIIANEMGVWKSVIQKAGIKPE